MATCSTTRSILTTAARSTRPRLRTASADGLLLRRQSSFSRPPPPVPPGTPVHGVASLTASATFTPPLPRRSLTPSTPTLCQKSRTASPTSSRSRSMCTSASSGRTTSGAYLDEPKREARFGLLKVFLTVMTGISIGAWISKKMAAFLEENELFVPEDDDDDDDDDD